MATPTVSFANQRPQFLALYPDGSLVLLHGHEALEAYRPGGYHPVSLGDSFLDGRYVIRNKLGYGGYSTVWLARDETAEYVAADAGCSYGFLLRVWHSLIRQIGNGCR